MTKPARISDDTLETFLAEAGWAGAKRTPLAADASSRSYVRLYGASSTALLMMAPPGAEEAACPPGASAAMRRKLGYNALARLAGPNLNAFVEIAATLRGAGLSAPDIYAADAGAGLAVIEDFGDGLFARAIERGADEEALYGAAIDALAALAEKDPARPSGAGYAMQTYDAPALLAEAALLIDWYWPLKKGAPAADNVKATYNDLWRSALRGLSRPHVIVLRDYHAENLLWLPDRDGAARAGVIDFQDALYGHSAYDLVSLLEDARRDVDSGLAKKLLIRYIDRRGKSGAFDLPRFEADYGLLAAQRNAKILGIFARLAKRDGKDRYLSLLPRVEAHFRRDLARDGLQDLRTFFADALPELVA
ncbi:MAG: phosphotransferase [Pseudomonadota bacterium]